MAPAATLTDASRAGNGRAIAAIVLGLLATATLPLAIVATRYSKSWELVEAGYAIPVAVVLAIAAIRVGRGALRHDDVRLGRAGGRRPARAGVALGVLGLALAGAAVVALSVYGLLTYLGER